MTARCPGCSHEIHAPDECAAVPVSFGTVKERECACPIDNGNWADPIGPDPR